MARTEAKKRAQAERQARYRERIAADAVMFEAAAPRHLLDQISELGFPLTSERARSHALCTALALMIQTYRNAPPPPSNAGESVTRHASNPIKPGI